MTLINDLLKKIKEAIYGEEVRNSIHDAIEQCYEDATGHPDSVAATVKEIAEVSTNLSKETANRKAEVGIERKRIDNLVRDLPNSTGEYQQSKLVLHGYDNATTKCGTTSGQYTNVPAFTTDSGGALSSLYTKKSNYQIAVNKSGLYLFELRIHVNSLIANKRVELAPFVNDTRNAALASSYNTAGNFTLTQVAALPLWLSANDTVDFRIAPIEAAEVSLQLGDVLVYAIDWEDKFKIPDYTGYAAETKDIRTGADGTVYGTAGEAVRKQIGNLTEDLGNIGKVIEVGGEKTITTPQLADISTIKVGRPTFKYHQTKYNDELSSEEYYRTLDAIEFTDESIKTLRLNFKPASIICFRAQDGMAEGVVPIANVTDNGDNSFSFATTTANKAKWIRISWSNTQYPNLVPLVTNEDEWDANADKTFIGSKIIKLPTSLKDKVVNISNLGDDVLKLFNPEIINPCDYKGDEIRIFGKGLCIGDSLTYGQSDRNDTGSLDGFKHAGMNYPDNLMRLTGIDLTNAGTAGKTFQTWWELHENDDFSGHDFCIIALGVNDAYFNKMWTDDSLTYLTNIVNAVRTANNHIPIFITTPPMYFLGYTGADFESVAEGIRNAATSLNLYLVDFRKYLTEFSRVNAEKVSVMAYGHFNAYGYYKIAVAYKSYISYIISQNMDDFRNVQFVGTNYSYSSN